MAEDKLLSEFVKPRTHVWEQRRIDRQRDTLAKARDIGNVRLNHSRLNLFTSLKLGDEVDHFKFRALSNGPLHLGMSENPDLRIEILDAKKKVIADSDANNPELFKEFLEFNSAEGKQIERGNYYIRVSRLSGNPELDEHAYTLQLAMGNEVRHDYDTFEAPAQEEDIVQEVLASAPVSVRNLQAQGNVTLLTGALAFLASLLGQDDNSGGGLFG